MWGAILKAGVGMWGKRQASKEADKNRQYQQEQQRLAYERSMPWSSQGPAGNVNFDPESKQMIQSLSPEYQAMMDGWLGTSGMANEALQGMMRDPYAMEQEQFKRFEEMNADAYSQSRMQGQESALASGRMGGTQGYYDTLATEGAISKDRLGGQMQAMNTGMAYRQMLGQESQGFGQSAMNVAGMLMPQAQLGQQIGQGLDQRSNMQGMRQAGDDYTTARNAGNAGLMNQFNEYDFEGLFSGLGNSGRAAQRASNPRQYSSLFNQGKIGNNQFGGDY
tara:strand:- start:464 stop:1297 length:834 start_codon:yes stop_codon:yes gene_type:complete